MQQVVVAEVVGDVDVRQPRAVRSAAPRPSVQPVDFLNGTAPRSATKFTDGLSPAVAACQRSTCRPPPLVALDSVSFISTLSWPRVLSTSDSGK